MQKLKVAHIIRVFSYGGAEVLLRECFAHPYFKEQITSDLYILDHKKLGLINEVKSNVKSIHYYKISSIKFLLEYIKFFRQIIKGKYDVVHMHLPVAGWLTIPVKLFTGKPKYIYSEHNLVTFYSKYNYYLIGLMYRFFDCVIYVSNEVGEVINQVHKSWFFKLKKTVTILNGIDTDKFSNAYRKTKNLNENFTVGLVARFRKQKRIDKWIEVAAEINKLNPSIKFLLVGNGPEDTFIRNKIHSLNMQHNIQLPGMLNDTVAAFKEIDIFLLTSDFEGLPLALIEAMSTGCVPVVSNVGGIKQLIFDGFGYKYNVFNAFQLAEIISAYANHPQQFETESLKARAFVEHNFSLTKQVHEMIALYKQVKN